MTETPESYSGGGYVEGPENLFGRINGDCIIICDLRGLGADRDFLLKDRYNNINIWAYTDNLEQLWHYSGKLAHSPLVYDVDDDGRAEVFAGDALLDHNGEIMWHVDIYDHCDSAILYKHEGKPIMAIANQNGGFYFINAENGEIIREYYLGHGIILVTLKRSLGYIGPQGEMLICGHTFWGGLN
jgi:hypothetical protein